MEKSKSLGKVVFEAKSGGKEFKFETGKLNKLASGSCIVTSGESIVMATVCVSEGVKEGIDYFPLSVDFQDKWYATGKISGSRFVKREGRGSELGILRSRMIDRSIRPMFPKGYMNEMQVIVTPLSMDYEIDPVVLGLNAASASLCLAGVPFEGPLSAARVGRVDGKLVLNPTYEEMEKSDLDILVAGTKEAITMIEGGGSEVPEDVVADALEFAHKEMQSLIATQEKLVKEIKVEERKYELQKPDEAVYEAVSKYLADKLGKATRHNDKLARDLIINELEDVVHEQFKEEFEEVDIAAAFDKVIKEEVRKQILEEGIRPDHRKMDEVRALSCEVGLLPRTHGSGLFNRGETQILSITTLGSPSKAQMIDSMDQDFNKRYIHHYVDTGASYGDIKRLGPGRRAIGHGFLAEKALEPVLPSEKDFPYTIRVVSEILSENGSSSMGSVCGSSLSLMDAGVPIKASIAGIAMGLMTQDGDLSKKHVILTDIQGAEDFAGDMDFKLAGSRTGMTAIQMDIKVKGLTHEFLIEVMKRAKAARLQILDSMDKAISEPKKEMSKYAPRLTTIQINPEKIRDVIGKGGEMINKIIAECEVEMDVDDEGTIVIASTSGENAQKAVDWIKSITAEPEVGKIYKGKVVKIMDFGAFVEFMPGKEGLVHISQIKNERVEKVTDELKEGQEVDVKLMEIDSQGRNNLSMKAVQKK
ncbi:polyribonucleotide nucleotidyltransferase [candidate division WS5 bacterium]|uniref:Polyribonucleotide nucleotidyltransferase n=1 Tax=candidate division WS5 bacterium TaxID=2093353 RepID=A0A419DEQ0_9BACT|nr:MAG: polyribonucleotide nucleotidyltransferase [candidate division WS5 bacterium]